MFLGALWLSTTGVTLLASKLFTFLPKVVAQIWLDLLRGFWGCWETLLILFSMDQLLHAIFGLQGVFLAWPWRSKITMPICNKFIEVNFCVQRMVSIPTLNICQILMRLVFQKLSLKLSKRLHSGMLSLVWLDACWI